MPPLLPLFALPAIGLAVVLYLKRREAVAQRWREARGEILHFGVAHGRPLATFSYEIEGKAYTGQRPQLGGDWLISPLPLRHFVDPYKGPLFRPGQNVRVYYDPLKPENAVLLRTPSPRLTRLLVAWLLVTALTFIVYRLYRPLGKDAVNLLYAIAILSMIVTGAGVKFVQSFLKSRRTRRYVAINGTLVDLKLHPWKDRASVQATYDYAVNGTRYRSTETGNRDGQQDSLKTAQARADALLVRSPFTVWHHRDKPWECTLEPSSPPIYFLAIVALAFLWGVAGIIYKVSTRLDPDLLDWGLAILP